MLATITPWLAIACVSTAPPSEPSSDPGYARTAPTPARPQGRELPRNLLLEGEISLCCVQRRTAEHVEPAVWETCVLIEHSEAGRMACYDDGFEAVQSFAMARVIENHVVEIIPPGYQPGALGVQTHTCHATITCPKRDNETEATITCSATGPKALCEEHRADLRIRCQDDTGDQQQTCPEPPKEGTGSTPPSN